MEAFLSRYRNLSVLLALVVGQLLLLAYQVRTNQDVRLIRVWFVSAVTPLAQLMEGTRSNTTGFVSTWLMLHDVQRENERLKQENGKLKIENNYLRTELAVAERAKALAIFQKTSPSKTVAARIIGTGTGINARTVYVDRGTRDGVERGMAAILPDGIVGKVVSSFPTASLVMLATEPSFAASVVSQKSRMHGMARGRGSAMLVVDNLSNLQKVEEGEWFFTTGEDRIFPRGMPVGPAHLIQEGNVVREVQVRPVALHQGLEEVLIVVEGVHGEIPGPDEPPSTEVSLLPPPPKTGTDDQTSTENSLAPGTEADQAIQKYKKLGEQQNFVFGTTMGRSLDANKAPPAPKPEAVKPAEAPKAEEQKPPSPPPTPPVKQ